MLSRVDEIIDSFLDDLKSDEVKDLYKEITSGKKLRAKLILKIADFSDKAYVLAAIVEMIQVASLLHDDVIDEADMRRGKSSINALFGDKTAIMLGDILYSKAFFELNSLPPFVAKSISNAVSKLSIGELLDVELSKSFNDDEDRYFDMIDKKTASLIEASAESAAYLCDKDSDKFALYGKNLGLAFQVVDDILDITQDSKTLGKPSMHDFKEGKTTLPYIHLYKRLPESDKDRLISFFKCDLTQEDRDWIKERMDRYGSLEESSNIAKALAKEAIESIKEYKDSDLEKIIVDMTQREY